MNKTKNQYLTPEEEREMARKVKQKLEQMDTEVPYSLRPENISPILNRPVKTVSQPKMVTRWVAVAAAFALVIGAVTVLPRYMGNSDLTGDTELTANSLTEESVSGNTTSGDESINAVVSTAATSSQTTTSKNTVTVQKSYAAINAAIAKVMEYNQNNYTGKAYTNTEDGTVTTQNKTSTQTVSKSATASSQANAAANANPSTGGDTARESTDYSTTNVQVKGVDEPDIIKTDGKYIYTVTNFNEYTSQNGARVSIIQADKNGEMTQLWQNVSKEETINEIFLENNRLVLLKSPNSTGYIRYAQSSDKAIMAESGSATDYNWTFVEIYDVTDPKAPKLTRRFEQEGFYTTARTLNGYLCLVSGKSVYTITDTTKAEDIVPKTADSRTGGTAKVLPASKIMVMPDLNAINFTTVTMLSISNASEAASTQAVMASGGIYYANLENIYIASYRYDWTPITGMAKSMMAVGTSSTEIVKVSLLNGKVTPLYTGTVKGTLCSQFAMDEYNGYFRVATNLWDYNTTTQTSKQTNNFYVLDKNMKIVGTLEGLAPGENMYSVRFEGNTVYAVTYRQTDPFFVIDLTNPTKPVVKGELKIPGFSQYLHPYSDTLMIGFGMDTIETSSTTALTQGFKISMFDVSDPANPKEVHKILIGDRGSYSPINYNHKALLFSKDKNIIGIPITIYKSATGDPKSYGELSFEGYIVLGYDATKGFYEKGRVTHITDLAAAMTYRTGTYQTINRAIYIGDVLYTLSNNVIVSTSLTTFKQIDKIEMYYETVQTSSPAASSESISVPAVSKVY